MDLLKFYKTHLFIVCESVLEKESDGEKYTIRLFLPCDKCKFNISNRFSSVLVTNSWEIDLVLQLSAMCLLSSQASS